MNGQQRGVPHDDIFNDYEGNAFWCLNCEDHMVYVMPGESECFVCGQKYDTEIKITLREDDDQ